MSEAAINIKASFKQTRVLEIACVTGQQVNTLPRSLILQQIVLVAHGLVPHGLQDASHRASLACSGSHVGLELVVYGGQAFSTVLLPHLVVDGLVVDEPEFVLGVVGSGVEQLGTKQLGAAQLQLAVKLVKGLGITRASAIDAHGKDALVGHLGHTGVEPRRQAQLARRLDGRDEYLQLRQRFVHEGNKLGNGARGQAEVLDHVFFCAIVRAFRLVLGQLVEETHQQGQTCARRGSMCGCPGRDPPDGESAHSLERGNA